MKQSYAVAKGEIKNAMAGLLDHDIIDTKVCVRNARWRPWDRLTLAISERHRLVETIVQWPPGILRNNL